MLKFLTLTQAIISHDKEFGNISIRYSCPIFLFPVIIIFCLFTKVSCPPAVVTQLYVEACCEKDQFLYLANKVVSDTAGQVHLREQHTVIQT